VKWLECQLTLSNFIKSCKSSPNERCEKVYRKSTGETTCCGSCSVVISVFIFSPSHSRECNSEWKIISTFLTFRSLRINKVHFNSNSSLFLLHHLVYEGVVVVIVVFVAIKSNAERNWNLFLDVARRNFAHFSSFHSKLFWLTRNWVTKSLTDRLVMLANDQIQFSCVKLTMSLLQHT
jgi:hypothetical protein